MAKSENSILGIILGENDESYKGISPLPEEMPVAMAYVPYQQWKEVYEDDVALQRGTIFPCLDKPFLGEETVKNGNTK